MILILIGPGMGFPYGYASTSRTLLYARGLHMAGSQVRVICLGPSEYPGIGVLNQDTEGIFEEIAFEYTCGTPVRGKTQFKQTGLVLKGLMVAARRIFTQKRDSLDAIILYSDRWVAILLFGLIAKITRTIYIYERCEEPFYQGEQNLIWRLVSTLYTHTLYRLFDGVIVISDYLWKYMQTRTRKDTLKIKVPILVNIAEFTSSATQPLLLDGKYIAYCGSLNETKDGVLTIMKAFSGIAQDFPDVNLLLIGDSIRKSQIPPFKAYAQELEISDRVIFTGLISRQKLILYLRHAVLLTLARPATRQSKASFPTKLGEYLACGKPVLATDTGEISTYLQDGVNVFLSPPNNLPAFTERLRYILLHPEESQKVGLCGQSAAKNFFDFKENGLRLKAFIDQLNQGGGKRH